MRRKGPSIYVADLASYNRGKLKGEWVDISGMTGDEIAEAIQDVVGDNEWAIHDVEGFGSFDVGEYPDTEELAAVVEAIEEYGEAAIGAALSYGTKPEDVVSFMQDSYQGEWDSEEDFVENLLSDTGQLDELPEWAQPYFDIEKYTNDLFMGDYWSAHVDGKTLVFASR